MHMLRQTLTKTRNYFSSKFESFFYGEFFPAIVALIAIFFYYSDCKIVGLSIFLFFAILIFLLFEDLCPIIPLLMTVLMMFNDFDIFSNPTTYIPLGITFVAFVLHFIIYPPKFEKGLLFLPLIILSVALFLSGIFSPYLSCYMDGIAFRIAAGPVVLLVYYVFTTYVKPKNNFDLKKYTCYVLVIVGLTCFAQFALNRLGFNTHEMRFEEDLGWNNPNGVASLLLVTIPAGFYLLVNTKRTAVCLISIICMYCALILSKSEGCICIGVLFVPILSFYAYKFSNKKFKSTIIINICLLMSALTVILLTLYFSLEGFNQIVDKIVTSMSSPHGRNGLYEQAVEMFSKFPIFGTGFGYKPPNASLETNSVVIYNYHSTLLHIMATMGIVGIIVYAYYFVNRYRILTHKFCDFNMFAFLSFTMMEVYGFIDTSEFNIMPLMVIVTILLIAVEKSNDKKENLLPLTKQI